MAPLGRSAAIAAAFMAALVASGAAAADRTARTALAEARVAFAAGDREAASATLRGLRASFPGDPLVADSFALDADISLAAGDPLRARSFYARLAALFPRSAAAFATAISIADWYHDRADEPGSLEYYLIAIEGAGDGTDQAGIDRARVRAAGVEAFRAESEGMAREHFRAVQPDRLSGPDRELYRTLRVRLAWERLGPDRLGLSDANISALAVDGDDLWVGTWNGGTARWSLSAGRSTAFPSTAYPRAFEPTERRVWVATFEGLASYSRLSGRWSVVDELQQPSPAKVQALETVGDDLYAGTLGDGLLRLHDGVWGEVTDGGYPGRFVNCLASDGGHLFVGTMDLGLLVLDLASGRFESLADLAPSFTARNITTVLAAPRGRVWIGTYGEGLWVWEGGAVRRFGRDTGEIGDDWVLASCRTDTGVWFGTFGAGASFFSDDGTWRRLGVADGLPSLDVSAIAWRPPWLFLGTLGAGVSAYWERADGSQP